MQRTRRVAGGKIGFVICTVLLAALTGCVGYVDRPGHGQVYARPPSVYVDAGGVMQDDYVYYPDYQVYYSSTRRQYVYRVGRSWISRPAPPRVPVNVLLASPSVKLDFHDSPSIHNTTVVRRVPETLGAASLESQPSAGKPGQWKRK